MSERKVLNKYYPPDFDPSKIPRMKLAKNRQYTVRLMAPFNMRCVTCGEYIYKGKKFNARKEDVENEDYLGIRIYRFYIKCTRCLQEISFKTDPKNTDYEIEAGATRNFMALKLAEEQAKREEDELKEEEANNPMKLLENRTEQSRNEIELLESLEELKDLNRRQATVDFDTMLQQYIGETPEERKKREDREDEEFIKSIKFQKKDPSQKIIVTEEIIEDFDDAGPPQKKMKGNSSNIIKSEQDSSSVPQKEVNTFKSNNSKKNNLSGLVKLKTNPTMVTKNVKNDTANTEKNINVNKSEISNIKHISTTNNLSNNGLSLLAGYSGSDSDTE